MSIDKYRHEVPSKLGKVVRATSVQARLGGNTRVGVFATRSPFRPNPLGLSVVKLKRVEQLEKRRSCLSCHGGGYDGWDAGL